MSKRIQLIKEWIECASPRSQLADELHKLPSDYEGTPFKLEKSHLKNILNRYLANELQKQDVYKWAELIEMRDDIDYESVADIISLLANHEINGALTHQIAQNYLQEIANHS